MQQPTVEGAGQERLQIAAAVASLGRKRCAAANLTEVLLISEPVQADILQGLGVYYAAESRA